MRTAFFAFFGVFMTVSSALADSANMTAILSLRKGAEISSADLQRILKNREILKSRDLFLPAEKKVLKSIQADYLTKAWVLEFKNEKSFDALEKQIRRQGLPLNLDWNEMKVSRQSVKDPYAGLQWGLNNRGEAQSVDLDPMRAYKIAARIGEDLRLPSPVKAKKKIIVAVLDTGIDKTHPDLRNRIVRKDSECEALAKFEACVADKDRKSCEKIWMDPANKAVDQDGNGYPMDCQGWSLLGGVNAANIMGRPDFGDDQGHGTHVAGIVAAEIGNGIGGRGVSDHVEILPVQVLGATPSEPLKPLSVGLNPTEEGREEVTRSLGDLVARGVIYAIRSGAQVINFSMGWPQNRDSEFMRSVIAEAQSRGIIVVAASGNDSTRALLRPCAYPGVICVGAHGPDGAPAHFSNHGSGVDITAPGVNIFSTYPMDVRPVRFRDTKGWEFLSGTSQASPAVAGAIGEMLARGIPAVEIYPRLILSSRPVKAKLPLLEGLPHEIGRPLPADLEPYKKIAVGGNMDLSSAISQMPQPLVVPFSKEKREISWDRQAKTLSLEVSLRNHWQPVADKAVSVRVSFPKPHPEAIRPTITGLEVIEGGGAVWGAGQERKYRVTFSLDDAARGEDSRIPSELDLGVIVEIAGTSKRSFVVPYEVVVPVSEQTLGDDVVSIALEDMPRARTSFLPIEETFDGRPFNRDYFVVSQEQKSWQVWVASQDGSSADSPYRVRGGAKIRLDVEDVETIDDRIRARIDIDGDGRSEYVLGLYEDRSDREKGWESPMTFHVYDSEMRPVDSFIYDSKLAQIPFTVYWMRTKGGRKMPAWVGMGKDPERRRGLRDRWENPDNDEKRELRFYYLDENKKLKAVKDVADQPGYKIIDVIEPREAQKKAGRVPVLLAKNLGSEAKPSYLYEFAVGEMIDGRLENFREIDLFQDSRVYRNLMDTRVDKAYSLDPTNEEFQGSFWFGEGLNRQQRLSILETGDLEFIDQQLSAERAQFDSALWVRAAFAGKKRKGAFVLTNSEIQYHDLTGGRVVSASFERYTFYPDMLMTNLYFPLVLQDSQRLDAKLPALFTTESSGLNRGVKMLVPVFAKSGSLVELVSPARLRLKTAGGCRPLETPVFRGADGHAFDYFCGNKILRIRLNY